MDTAKTAKSSNMTDQVSSTQYITNSSMSNLFKSKYQSNMNSEKQQKEEEKDCQKTIEDDIEPEEQDQNEG